MATIMIVDHKLNDSSLLKTLLSESHEILSVSSSKEAFEQLESSESKHIDLILVDTQIPGSVDHGFFSLKPSSTMKTAQPDAFLTLPMPREKIHEFIAKALQERDEPKAPSV